MGKMFSDLTELHRTFTVPVKEFGPVRRQDELEKEAIRLKDHLHVSSSARKYGRRSTVFSAVELSGNNLVPVDIWESWNAQDFARYATHFEEQNSILCDPASLQLTRTVLAGGPGQFLAPVVLNSGNLCFLVVGHTGIVMGDRVIIPHPLAARSGGDPEAAMSRGIPLYVTKDNLRPPDAWVQLGVPDVSYQVMVTPDGRVTRLHKYSSRGLASANWVIDLVVAPAVIAMTKSGARMAMSLMERMPAGKMPTLAGPTRELAKEAEAAAELSAARLSKAVERAIETQLNLQNKIVTRTVEELKQPTVFRHTITSDVPPATFAQIEKAGSLTFSIGAKAHYGEGVYVWGAGATNVGRRFIDIQVPAGVVAERLQVQGVGEWFRLVTVTGNKVPVKIVGHNFTKEEVEFARRFIAG